MLHSNRSKGRARFGALAAAAVAAASFSAREASARDGSCQFDVKPVAMESKCLRSIWCGGAGGTLTVSGVTIRSTTDGSILCCVTEVVEPAHTEVVKGNKRLVHVADVTGTLITRRCTGPVVLFWIEFGSWKCETDSITPFGSYSIDRAEVCD